MKWFKIIGIMFLATSMSASPGKTADLTGNWGGGVFGSLYSPFFKFRDMYKETVKFGGSVHYVFSPRKLMELEFHYAKFSDGSLENRTFTYSDGKDYVSPNAKSDMAFKSVAVNWLISLKSKGFGQGGVPYVTFGTGFL